MTRSRRRSSSAANVDHFLLEYDTARAGGFAPLRFVPKDKGVVLGMVSSKVAALEPMDLLKRRATEAARYVDGDRLALSPQCGFASTVAGNPVSEADMRAKLASRGGRRAGHLGMTDSIRNAWLGTIVRFQQDLERPGSADAWSPALDFASADEIRSIQSEKLVVAVRFVYECIPFYRRKFDAIGLEPGDIRGLDDLVKIPVTTKQEMAEDVAANPPWGTYTSVDDRRWRESGWQTFASSGTTSRPRLFRYTQFDRRMWAWVNARAMWAMGFRPGRDSALLAFGYGPHVWLWGVHYALNLMGIPIVTGGGLDTRIRARFIHDYAPTILCCTPSYALYLAGVMREMGMDPAATAVRFLFCAGEPGFGVPATRERLERTWNAELHEFYGCTEAAPAGGGYTCSAIAAGQAGFGRHAPDGRRANLGDRRSRYAPSGARGTTRALGRDQPDLRGLAAAPLPGRRFHRPSAEDAARAAGAIRVRSAASSDAPTTC